MEWIAHASEDEMIQLFLKAEINSERFGESLKNIIADLEKETGIPFSLDDMDERSCQLRRQVLSRHRGYGVNGDVFEDFPDEVDWNWAYLNKTELQNIKYINYSYWNELTGGTRYAKDAVKTIKNDIRIFDVPNDGFLKTAEVVRNGASFQPLIIVASRKNPEERIVLEGHLRLTAYMLAIDCIESVKVMIGYADLKPDF